mmetsp:Transcript_4284/g.6835  ORF Transcript_4284/g.6835 Transcript_4284/m.6835 type:complete len:291 (+) Transcript_4284:173-1045(+)
MRYYRGSTEILSMTRLNAPGVKFGFSSPPYSNLDSISCMLTMRSSWMGASVRIFSERKFATNWSAGASTVIHSPATVSKEKPKLALSHPGSSRRMNLYRLPSPFTRRRSPWAPLRFRRGVKFRVRTLANPPLLAVLTTPEKTAASLAPVGSSAAPGTNCKEDSETPPMTTSSRAPHCRTHSDLPPAALVNSTRSFSVTAALGEYFFPAGRTRLRVFRSDGRWKNSACFTNRPSGQGSRAAFPPSSRVFFEAFVGASSGLFASADSLFRFVRPECELGNCRAVCWWVLMSV